MAEKEKTFRTSAFYTDGHGGYLYRFWIMSPAYNGPGYQIKEYEKGAYSGCTSRIADHQQERDALQYLANLERSGGKKVTGKDLDDLGPEYRDAELFTDYHDAIVSERTHDILRKRRPGPDFRPK